MPSAESVFGIDLGGSRYENESDLPNTDTFSIDVQNSAVMGASIFVRFPSFGEEASAKKILQDALSDSDLLLDSLYFNDSGDTPVTDVRFRVPQSMPITEVAFHCQMAIALLKGATELSNSPHAIYRKLASGNWDSLKGVIENNWLEVKQKMYGLEDTRQQFEFALDVASIANLEEGGILIIGFTHVKNMHGEDTISDTRGRPQRAIHIPQLLSKVESLIYPRIQNLVISVFKRDDHEVLAILVPAQPKTKMPFLVKSTAINEERVYGNGFTWVARIGGTKQPASLEEIHRTLSEAL